MSAAWPVADIDAVRRLQVLAEAADASYTTAVVPASFEEVWAVVADLELELPLLLPDVRRFVITGREGDHLAAEARGYLGLRARFDVVLRPGWCVMQSRNLLGGFAATPADGGTTVGFLSLLRVPGRRLLAPVLDPVAAPIGRKVLARLAARVA